MFYHICLELFLVIIIAYIFVFNLHAFAVSCLKKSQLMERQFE